MKIKTLNNLPYFHMIFVIFTDGKHVILWGRISAEKGSVAHADLESMLAQLEVAGIDGDSMTFTSAVYQLPGNSIFIQL